MKKFIIEKIAITNSQKNSQSERDLIQRLYDLGLYPGLEVEVVSVVSFGSVTVIQYGNTKMALNREEFACLHGH